MAERDRNQYELPDRNASARQGNGSSNQGEQQATSRQLEEASAEWKSFYKVMGERTSQMRYPD